MSLLMGTAALSVIWPRYIFFSIGGPFVTPLTVGIWTQVVMVHDGAQDIIYFNGLKINAKAAPENAGNRTTDPGNAATR